MAGSLSSFLLTLLIGSTASFAAPAAAVLRPDNVLTAAVVTVAALIIASLFAFAWLFTRRRPAPAAPPAPGSAEIVDSAKDAIFVIEDNGAIVTCNRSAETLFGYLLNELYGKSIAALIPPPERGRRRGNYIHAAEGRVLSGVRKSGDRFPIDLMLSELPSSGGKRFSLILRDRSNRTRAEQELESEQQFASKVLDELPSLVLVTDHEGRIVRFNRACEDLTRFSEGEVRGQVLWQALASPADMEAAEREFLELLQTELPACTQSNWSTRDNTIQTIQWVHSAITDDFGRLSHIVSAGEVLMAGAQADNDQSAQSSLAATQRMAGGIAHTFSNLLTTISGYSSLVLSALDPAHPARRDVEEIRKAGDEAAVLTRHLLAFSGKQPVHRVETGLNEIVRGAERMLRSIAQDPALQIDLSLEDNMPSLMVDPLQLEECLLHLATHARSTMPNGGTLLIETSSRSVSRRRTDAQPPLEPGRYITLAVTDTGHGVSPELLPHIFEPFLIQSENPKATGMALAIASGIVRQNGGSIVAHSSPGCGATIRIYFPAASQGTDRMEVLEPEPQPEAQPEALGGDETILVATENDRDRRRMREALQQAGYLVLEARSALQAMEIAHKAPDAIHLAICDIQVPRMSGPELAATLRGIRGEIRSMYASSKSEEEMRRQGMEPSAVTKLNRDWDDREFLLTVRTALTAQQARSAAR